MIEHTQVPASLLHALAPEPDWEARYWDCFERLGQAWELIAHMVIDGQWVDDGAA